MAEQFVGDWRMTHQEMLGDMFKGMPTPPAPPNSMNPVLSIKVTNNGTHIEIAQKMYKAEDTEFKTLLGSMVTAFDLDKEVEEATPWGRKVKSATKLELEKLQDGSSCPKLVQTQQHVDDSSVVMMNKRWLTDGGQTMVVEGEGGGVKWVRKYARI